MTAAQDYRYVAYLAARLAAYRNVWWSLANEYDFLLDTKPVANGTATSTSSRRTIPTGT